MDATMAEVTDISPYLDERCAKLWKTLNSLFSLTVVYHYHKNYEAYGIGKTAIIFVPADSKPCIESFVHELLHLYIHSTQNHLGAAITLSVKASPVLSAIFSEQLLQYISNTLEHVKMFPLYLEMGYDKKLFISDFDKPKLTSADIFYIQNNFRKKGLFHKVVYKTSAIDSFIEKFFAACACPNDAINYSLYLNELKSLDHQLYFILDRFWQEWLNYDIFVDHDSLGFNYNDLCFNFIDELKKWTEGKKIHKGMFFSKCNFFLHLQPPN